MVKLVRYSGYLLFFLAMVLFFTPKIQLYYLLQKEIEPFGVVLDQEKIEDKGFVVAIEELRVFVEGIESAKIDSSKIYPFIVYNSLILEDINLSNAAKSFLPLNIKEVKISHLFYDPLHLKAKIYGEFGEAYGSFNLLERSLELRVFPSQKMQKHYSHTLRNFKKEEDGYFYAKTF